MPKSGASVSLDTNVVIAVLNDTRGVGEWVQGFAEVCLPAPVVGELLFGAINSSRPEENLGRIEVLVSRCRILPVTHSTAEVYARIRLDLKRKGRPIPENDLWIAAACVERNLSLATFDSHFGEVDGLILESV